jgi:phthiodiolone/phenolphthiodiolone dimycocerosates ketoreductase
MAAHRPRVLRATGELADGWMPVILDADEYGRSLAAVRAAAAAAGRDPQDVRAGLFVWIVCDEDRDAAERMLVSLLLRLILLTCPTEEFERAGVEHPVTGPEWGLLHYVPTRLSREAGLAAAAAVPDEVLRRYSFWGTPDDVVERLAPFRAAGLEHVYLVNVTPLADLAKAPQTAAHTEAITQGLRRLGWASQPRGPAAGLTPRMTRSTRYHKKRAGQMPRKTADPVAPEQPRPSPWVSHHDQIGNGRSRPRCD